MPQKLLIRTAAAWKIPREVAIAVIARDTHCIYCRVLFEAPYVIRARCPSWEHIVNDLTLVGAGNIGLCCVSCNASKGKRSLIDWLSSPYCFHRSISRDSIALVARAILSDEAAR
jgi:hypothetical protein